MVQQHPDTDLQRRQNQSLLKVLPLVVIIGLGLTASGIYLALFQVELWLHGSPARGVVVALHSGTANSSGRSPYRPEVAFTTEDGKVVRFIHRTGQSPAAYAIGDEVELNYLPKAPQRALIDEAAMNLLLPGVLLLIGPALAMIALRGFSKVRRRLQPVPAR
ncbi:hypothetical protein A9Q89_06590 [Gammaproteobacteria bacterium 53_120_T64]|nr:hypothetical protein A9Q89_06590 [Gammaproteobacteria bacterium 53_120_T64]